MIRISFFLFFLFSFAHAQTIIDAPLAAATTTPVGTSSPFFERTGEGLLRKEDITKPEEKDEREKILSFFEGREARNLRVTNIFAYAIQRVVRSGVPANTVILILLLPFLATLVAITRLIIGLPSLEMLVPIVLAVTLIASGISAGFIILATILIASIVSRIFLKRLRIMQLPKMALSLLIVSLCVFGVLGVSAAGGVLNVEKLSIFPVLILILLSDKIVALYLQRSTKETALITAVTIGLGVGGYYLLTWEALRRMVLLYPETIFILIPVNIIIGRYLGLRVTEYFRFANLKT